MSNTTSLSRSILMALACWTGLASTSWAQDEINLELRLDSFVGSSVEIGLYAVPTDGLSGHTMIGADVVFTWDPTFLQFDGIDCSSPPAFPWLTCTLPSVCPNESIPPADGDGFFLANTFLPPANPPPLGLLVVTFLFTAQGNTCGTQVSIIESALGCIPPTDTAVWDGDIPNFPIQNLLGTISIAIVDPPCPIVLGDMNCDDVLDGEDITGFAQALTDPGEYTINFPGCDINKADMNGDGTIDMADVPLFAAALLL